jgi:hypothetical protein
MDLEIGNTLRYWGNREVVYYTRMDRVIGLWYGDIERLLTRLYETSIQQLRDMEIGVEGVLWGMGMRRKVWGNFN